MKNHTRTRIGILLLLFALNACNSINDSDLGSFTIKGELIGQDTGTIYLSYESLSTRIHDTALIEKGIFIFEGHISEPTEAMVTRENEAKSVRFYMESGVMKLSLSTDNFADFKLTGSKTQLDNNELTEMTDPVYDRIQGFSEQTKELRDLIDKEESIAQREKLEQKLNGISQQWSDTRDELDEVWLKFVQTHPSSYVTPRYLHMLEANEVIGLDTLISLFDGLDLAIQNSLYGNRINDHIRLKEKNRIGNVAPEFKALDIHGQTLSLSQFKNNSIVLLDFWASWCVPCREEIKFLKVLYEKYHSQGLEIVGISQDRDKEAWLSAIKQDGIDIWHHIHIAEKYEQGPDYYTNDDVITNYFVQGIPVTMLIDQDGRIVGKWVGASEENERILEEKVRALIK